MPSRREGAGPAPAPAPRRCAVLLLFGGGLALALPFLLAPRLDIAAVRWLAPDGRFLEVEGWLGLLYHGLVPLAVGTAAAIAGAACGGLLFGRVLPGLTPRAALFAVLTLALGPGLVVDAALKDQWGRARPRDIAEFGGAHSFTPALQPADQCAENCSFVSGHTAFGFWFLAPALLLPAGRRRRIAVGAVLAFGTGVGLMRMAQGAHFPSDVIFAALVTSALVLVLHRLIMRQGAGPPAFRSAPPLPPVPGRGPPLRHS